MAASPPRAGVDQEGPQAASLQRGGQQQRDGGRAHPALAAGDNQQARPALGAGRGGGVPDQVSQVVGLIEHGGKKGALLESEL